MIDSPDLRTADEPVFRTPPARRGGAGRILVASLLAFLLGAGALGWAAWEGVIPPSLLPKRLATAPASPAPAPSSPATPLASPAAPQGALADAALGVRLDALAQQLDALELRAQAAAGNAARAEGLLVAFASRRMIDQGAPLGYLEDQLRLRFSDAQPNAVDTIIGAARNPVTMDQLLSRLEELAPTLQQRPSTTNAWQQIRSELGSLFVIRRGTSPSPSPESRLERAQQALIAGHVDAAIADVARMPGARAAADWLTDARRYAASHRALDLIETTALHDTSGLQDSRGQTVEQPSPAAPPPV